MDVSYNRSYSFWYYHRVCARCQIKYPLELLGKPFMADEKAIEMAASMGMDANTYKLLGFIEILSLVFFIIPRTGVIGTLLLCAYMGGAIATHLEHGQSIMAPCIIQAFLWAVAIYRFPELTNRLRNK